MKNINENNFHIGKQEIHWSVKLFIITVLISCFISMLFYFLSLVSSSSESVDMAITSTTSMAMQKVDSVAEHLNLMWSIFLFNSLAVVTTSIVPGLLSYIQNVSIAELKLRARNQKYTTFSVKLEKVFQFLISLIKDILQKLDPGVSRLRAQDNSEKEGSIWKCANYNKENFRLLAYVIPHLIPIITLTMNGMLLGITLSFFVFNGAISFYDFSGSQGIVPGILFSIVYFLAFILPHGIIELPVIIIAAAIGYRFARVYSGKILEDNLLLGDEVEKLERDLMIINDIAAAYIRSRYLWTMVSIMIVFLWAAAYIEANITPTIAQEITNLFVSLLI
ncbi:stage II sporulation protein M [uncultured Methanomethylovorans sp.]|uniref:stage II sporulation protein M n=1 Tax=uncultured Methanomethylovorans sp. TaxID=183759 RepID=UPI002AA71E82|nr:stage II sporulation protein M [uncultured Methanomethylovorans sp.]